MQRLERRLGPGGLGRLGERVDLLGQFALDGTEFAGVLARQRQADERHRAVGLDLEDAPHQDGAAERRQPAGGEFEAGEPLRVGHEIGRELPGAPFDFDHAQAVGVESGQQRVRQAGVFDEVDAHGAEELRAVDRFEPDSLRRAVGIVGRGGPGDGDEFGVELPGHLARAGGEAVLAQILVGGALEPRPLAPVAEVRQRRGDAAGFGAHDEDQPAHARSRRHRLDRPRMDLLQDLLAERIVLADRNAHAVPQRFDGLCRAGIFRPLSALSATQDRLLRR